MSYSHTSLAIDSKLDIVSKYSELVEVKQDDDIMHSYTVAKAIDSIDWDT